MFSPRAASPAWNCGEWFPRNTLYLDSLIILASDGFTVFRSEGVKFWFIEYGRLIMSVLISGAYLSFSRSFIDHSGCSLRDILLVSSLMLKYKNGVVFSLFPFSPSVVLCT